MIFSPQNRFVYRNLAAFAVKINMPTGVSPLPLRSFSGYIPVLKLG
jgi:hypothetical protein